MSLPIRTLRVLLASRMTLRGEVMAMADAEHPHSIMLEELISRIEKELATVSSTDMLKAQRAEWPRQALG